VAGGQRFAGQWLVLRRPAGRHPAALRRARSPAHPAGVLPPAVVPRAHNIQMLLPAAASRNDKDIIVVYSEGYDKPFEIDTSYLEPSAVEKGSPSALIRGIIARFKQLDFNIGGFSVCVF